MVRALLDVTAVPARPVGAGVYTIELARALHAHAEVDLHLVTRRSDTERWGAIAPGATVHAVAPANRPARLAWEQAGAHRVVRRVQPDVWHGPHYTMPARLPVPAVVTVHDMTFFDHAEWHERAKVPFFRSMIRASAARARAIVCVSHETAHRLAAITGRRDGVFVAHHGVDHRRFRPTTGEADDRARDLALLASHGIAPPFVASHPGTFEPRKDIPVLVAAFAGVARDRPDLRLVVAGAEGWGTGAVRDAIAHHRIATRVVRPGYLPSDALPALLRQADAVAYPSQYEGFGLPALEALACGAPLVTTKGSALEEVVGDAALLVPPGDADSLRAALESLLVDEQTVRRLRDEGPRHAARFTWEASVATHLDAYRAAAHRGVAG